MTELHSQSRIKWTALINKSLYLLCVLSIYTYV
jgi:hypothetical protein